MIAMRGTPGRGRRAHRGSWSLAAGVACLAILLVACSASGTVTPGSPAAGGGGAAGGSSPAPGGQGSTPGPIPAGLVDPCGLLSAETAAKVADGTILAGIRDQEEDGTYVQCLWRNDRAFLAGEVDFAPPIVVYLTVRTDAFAQQLEASIGSGAMDVLPGTAAGRAAITSADLGIAGVAGAAGIKGDVYFRITCWSPQVPTGGQKKTSKAICSDAATAVAASLP